MKGGIVMLEIKIKDLTKNDPTATELGIMLTDVMNQILEYANNKMTVEKLQTDDLKKEIIITISENEEEP